MDWKGLRKLCETELTLCKRSLETIRRCLLNPSTNSCQKFMKNWFKNFIYCAILVSAGLSMLACAQGDSMKLVNTKTGFVVVEFERGLVHFHDRFLEAEMKETGILIPPSHQA